MQYYECHITMEADAERITPLVVSSGWKFSAIHGDTVFGDTVKCYATSHFHASLDRAEVINRLHATADTLAKGGAKILRRKIELVIYDDRSSKVKLDD